jgi:hypothetical protein
MEDLNTTRPFNNIETSNQTQSKGDNKRNIIIVTRTHPKEVDFDLFTTGIVKCNKVTTEWLGSKTSQNFSYLTNPQSCRGKSFYLIKNNFLVFEPQVNFQPGFLAQMDLALLNNFINELNSKNLKKAHQDYFDSLTFSRYLAMGLSMGVMFLGAVATVLVMAEMVPPVVSIGSILLLIGILLLLGLSYLKYPVGNKARFKFYQSKYIDYTVLIEKWNVEHFSRVGVHCSTVQNLNYIQFTTIKDKIVIQPHCYPEDIAKTFLSDKNPMLVDPQSNVVMTINNTVRGGTGH